MLDAMACEPAVFEPEEVAVLTAAYAKTMRRCRADLAARPSGRLEIARLVHNLGRSRLKLKKPLRTRTDALALAEEAAELFRYLGNLPDVVPAPDDTPRRTVPDRRVSLFAQSYRMPPSDRLA